MSRSVTIKKHIYGRKSYDFVSPSVIHLAPSAWICVFVDDFWYGFHGTHEMNSTIFFTTFLGKICFGSLFPCASNNQQIQVGSLIFFDSEMLTENLLTFSPESMSPTNNFGRCELPPWLLVGTKICYEAIFWGRP